MTYRERRMRKAERLRGWADSREAKAERLFTTAQEIGDGIPMGQPILVGHYSEAHHRRALDRIDSSMRSGIESERKAEAMRQRADNIERAAAHAIYSDDPDAIERLREKIARLEAQRKRITDYNASCRRAGKADPSTTHGDLTILDDKQRADLLDTMRACPMFIRKFGQFPSYETSNLGGTINAAKKRLTQMEGRRSARREPAH